MKGCFRWWWGESGCSGILSKDLKLPSTSRGLQRACRYNRLAKRRHFGFIPKNKLMKPAPHLSQQQEQPNSKNKLIFHPPVPQLTNSNLGLNLPILLSPFPRKLHNHLSPKRTTPPPLSPPLSKTHPQIQHRLQHPNPNLQPYTSNKAFINKTPLFLTS